MNKIFIINKPKDMTSNTCVNKLKKHFKANKVGHTGTLDPNTTGVLVCAMNDATKLIPLLNRHDKEYKTTILFGISTDTYDITGKVVKQEEVKEIDINKLDECLDILSKQTTQTPPIYSAIKVNGKKLYEYARENKEVEIKERSSVCYSIKRVSDVYLLDNYLCVDINLSVGAGYYVRSFVHDLGVMLSVCTTMKELCRSSCGEFNLDDSYTLEEVYEDKAKSLSIEELCSKYKKINVDFKTAKLIKNGQRLDESYIKTEEPFLIYHDNVLIAIYQVVEKNVYKPLLILK